MNEIEGMPYYEDGEQSVPCAMFPSPLTTLGQEHVIGIA